MVGLAISFPLGRYHATAWGAHVNEATVEWPPSPWRILRAIHSASLTDTRLTDRREALRRVVAILSAAGPPSYELPGVAAAHSRHYVPLASYRPTTARSTSLVIDAFHAISPDAELRVWWEADLGPDLRPAVAAVCASVGALGRSESVCVMRLLDEHLAPQSLTAIPATRAGALHPRLAGRVDALMVDPDAEDPVGVLETSVTGMRKARMLVPRGTRYVTYAVEAGDAPTSSPAIAGGVAPTFAHFRVVGSSRPALTDAVTVGHLLRAALQRRFDRRRDGTRSRVLSGRDVERPRTDQHAHAHYLVGTDARRDGRRVDHAFVWAPEGLGPDEVTALAGLSELYMRDIPEPVRVALVAIGRPEALLIPVVLGPAREWRSLTPFVLVRHPKRRGGRIVDGPEEQIALELSRRGLPDPEDIRLTPGRWMDFTRVRPGASRRNAPPVVGVRLRFPAPTLGPIVLGGSSHFGLGMFEPVDP